MKVFKATNGDMTCTMGKGTFQYRLGEPATAEASKCGDTGLHACEYVADCTAYYSLKGGNRFFRAEAEGDIAEDGINTRIACTKLTLVEELTARGIAREAMLYILRHPKREGWEKRAALLCIAGNEAWAEEPGGIAIARGKEPRVKGAQGSVLGLLAETEEGILAARLFEVDGERIPADEWLTVKDLAELERRTI